MPFDLLLIACHTLFKLGIEIKIIIVIIKMSDTYRNEKLYAQFFTAFVTVFVVLTKLLHCLEIKLFINEGRYITFKFPAVQKHSFRIFAYIKYFTSKRGKNTENTTVIKSGKVSCRQWVARRPVDVGIATTEGHSPVPRDTNPWASG